MLRVLIALALVVVTMPALAQVTEETVDECKSSDVDIGIASCTAMLRAKPAMLADYRLAAYMFRGMKYADKGLQDRAIADFTNAIALKPKPDILATLYNGIALASYRKKAYAECIANASKAIALKPEEALGYQMRGSAYELSEQHDAAIADYRTALKFNPGAENVKAALSRLGATP